MATALPLEQIADTFGRVIMLAQRLGRVQALQGLVDGIRAGGDAVELIEAMLAFEKLMHEGEGERRDRLD